MSETIQILNAYPIICPQIRFKDRFGNLSTFAELNPAIHFNTETNEWTVLVRGVNYRRLADSTFVMLHHPSHSLYWIGRGPSLRDMRFKELTVNFHPSPTYGSYWNGIEDLRFVACDMVTAVVPQLSPDGKPHLFKAHLLHDTVQSFQLMQPSKSIEKNWMPFGDWSVVYKVCPFIIKSLDEDEQQEIPLTPLQRQELDGYHGSTNGIKVAGNFLFLAHKNFQQGRTIHRWIWYNPTLRQVRYSSPFTFFQHSYIEFPCGLVLKDGSLYVSLGVNDEKAFIVEVLPPRLPNFSVE